MSRILYVYIVPAAVFASVVMGGGYGTGREVVEFFTRFGLLGGLLGAGIATFTFVVVLICTYEFARFFQLYDYRSFFKKLIGPFWICFEILYVLLFFLVIGVVSSAAGKMLEQEFSVSSYFGEVGILSLIIILVFFGRNTLEKVLTFWSIGMYVIFGYYFVEIFVRAETDIMQLISIGKIESGWFKGGVLYAMYNLAIAPVLLFSTRAIKTRKEAILSGVIAGVTVMIPAVLFHMSYAAGYPEVAQQSVPNYWMISKYSSELFLVLFLVALLGTFVQTGAGLVQGIVERIEIMLNSDSNDHLSRAKRATIAFIALMIGGILGSLGIVTIISKGYSALSVGFALVYIIPICTLGLVKIFYPSALSKHN